MKLAELVGRAKAASVVPVSIPAVAVPVPASAVSVPAVAYSVPAVLPSPNRPGERRATPRFPCEGTGEVIVLGGALRFEGQVLDLSAAGCCLRTEVDFTLERGTQVEIVLVVNGIHFRVAGGVRSNHPVRGVGLEFMHVSARSARYLQELIDELESKAKLEAARDQAAKRGPQAGREERRRRDREPQRTAGQMPG
jgi:hypothetical protein